MHLNFLPAVACVMPLLALPCAAQTIQNVSVPSQSTGTHGTALANGLSGDGRFAVFVSDGSNLVPGDTSLQDVFLRDFDLGLTTRITADSGVHLLQSAARISADGNVIGYSAQPTNAQFLPRAAFVFVRSTGSTLPVAPAHFEVTLRDLSADGTYAVVTARAANSTSSPIQVYRVHVPSGVIDLCSRDVNGNAAAEGFPDLFAPRIDGSGARVVFTSTAINLVPNDTNGNPDVFVLDFATNVLARANLDDSGAQTGGAGAATISDDGRLVCFVSGASNLVLGDTNLEPDVFVRDLALGTTTLVSLTTAQEQYTTRCENAVLSPSGRHVAFTHRVLTPAFPFDRVELKLRDLETGVTRSVDLGGAPEPYRFVPLELSDDGQRVLASQTEDFGSGSVPVLLDYGPPCSIHSYCTSLPNSTGAPAFIGAQGEASLESNLLVISALGMPSSALTMLLLGTSPIDPGVPFGNGLLCLGGTLRRLGTQHAVSGVIIAAQDIRGPGYTSDHPGDTRYFQVVYRDVLAGGAGFNTTDAIAVTFCW